MFFFEKKNQKTLDRLAPGACEALNTRNATVFTLFAWYLRLRFALRFHALRLAGATPKPIGPVIIYSNHPSWWDPAFYILLSHTLFRNHMSFGPMDEAALARYPILRRMGIFGIDPARSAGAARFLRISRSILARPDGAIWITAEGAFTDARTRPITLRPGIAHLAHSCPGVTIYPLALEYPFWNESHPEALARFGEPIEAGPRLSARAWHDRLQASLTETMDALAADSLARDPSRFRRLQRGSAGAGLIYDGWRRLGATLAGRRFSAAHHPLAALDDNNGK